MYTVLGKGNFLEDDTFGKHMGGYNTQTYTHSLRIGVWDLFLLFLQDTVMREIFTGGKRANLGVGNTHVVFWVGFFPQQSGEGATANLDILLVFIVSFRFLTRIC